MLAPIVNKMRDERVEAERVLAALRGDISREGAVLADTQRRLDELSAVLAARTAELEAVEAQCQATRDQVLLQTITRTNLLMCLIHVNCSRRYLISSYEGVRNK